MVNLSDDLATKSQSFVFVMNIRSLLGSTNFELAEGVNLRRANDDEIESIKRTLKQLSPQRSTGPAFWEESFDNESRSVRPLTKEEWRYYVLDLRRIDATPRDLETAFDLAATEIEVGFTLFEETYVDGRASNLIWNSDRLFHVLENAKRRSDFWVEVDNSHVAEIKSIYASLQTYDDRVLDVKRLLIQLTDLKGLPHGSPLRYLGYFGILESLLTHPPKPTDPYDSITRQVKKKLTLLNRRFVRAIDYSRFAVDPEKVWTRMYAYRSVIAHGGIPDFTRGDLVALKSPALALNLLRETTKALIRHALTEPQLVSDLREC